jgi:hypothetical protein
MKRLLAALAALLLSAVPVKAADASLELVTAGPYHYGGTIEVIAHGDYPVGKPNKERTTIQLRCFQGGSVVYTERIDDPVPDQPYTLHFGQWGLSQWDLDGGGAADCILRFIEVAHRPNVTPYTQVALSVEA